MAKKSNTQPPVGDPEYALVEQYVAAIKQQQAREQAMANAMQALAPDNAVFSLQCEEMHKLLSAFALKNFGETAVDWLGWWMWECDFGEKPAKMWMDGTEFDVTELGSLYMFCLRDTKTETTQP